MSNDTYLIVSYFVAVALCASLGVAAYLWLRKSAKDIAGSLPRENLRKIIQRAFPLSTILLALSCCLSVNYYGCEQKKYNEIVNDRSYITQKNAEQVSKALDGIIWSVALWSAFFAIVLRTSRRPNSK